MKKDSKDRSTKRIVQKRNAKRNLDEDDEMLDDYSFLDWSKAERGKYAKRYAEGTNVVLIEPDLMDVFPNADSVNQALRALASIIRSSSELANPRRNATKSAREKRTGRQLDAA